MSKSNELDSNIQTNTTGRLTPCLQKKIDKTTYYGKNPHKQAPATIS